MEVLLCHGESRKRARFSEYSINTEELNEAVFRLFSVTSCKYQIFEDKYNEYVDLDDLNDIRDACKIRILSNEVNNTNNITTDTVEESFEMTNGDLPSCPPMNLRTIPWRSGQFKLSLQNFDDQVRAELEDAMQVYNTTSKKHNMSWNLKHQMSNNVENYLVAHTMYPTEKQYEDVCSSIIQTFPCLASSPDYDHSGFGHLRLMFYNRMCTKRRSSKDDPECSLNAGIGKKNSGKRTVRATKGESNFLPKVLHPHTMETLAMKRDEIILARQAIPRDNIKIQKLMDETFPRRRHELLVSDKLRKLQSWCLLWPELSDPEELRREMQRLNCVDFQEGLMQWMSENLDALCVFANKSRIKRLSLPKSSECAPMEAVQEIPFLLADKAEFFLLAPGDCFDVEKYSTVAHIVSSSNHTYSIKAEGNIVVSNLPTFDMACWVLLAIYYCFDLQYPSVFRKSLFFLQHACGIKNGPCPKEVKNLLAKLEQIRIV